MPTKLKAKVDANPEPIRRSKRSKRIRYNLAEDDDDNLETMLEEHERKGEEYRAKRDAKKFKSEEDPDAWKHPGYEIPLDTLPALCIERILSYVSDPRDLYNLAFTNKFLASHVTPPLVIRSAVFHKLRKRKDAHHRKTLANIIGYLSNRSIHLPSAHRLLRLLNAKQCERGDDCWGKNLLTGKPSALDPTLTCRPFGLAICDKCIKFGTTNIPYSHFSRIQKGVAFYQWNKLMDPQIDAVTGERHGSLVRVIELQQIESSFNNQEERKEALESMVQRAHAAGAYCPRHYEENAAAYVEAFESAEKEADEFVRAEQARVDKLCNERREEKQSKKLARVRAIYDQFDEYLGDCPMKELALDCTWREHDYQECLKFKCTIVENVMRHMVSAPSSSSDRQIRDAAAQIKEAFTVLKNKNFFSFSFVSDSSHRYKKGLFEYCTTEATPLTIMSSNQADGIFISLVEQNQLTKALIRVFNFHRCSALSRAFALAVVRTTPNVAESQDRIENYRSLAETVWKKKNTSFGGMTLAAIKESYNTCLEEFKVVKRNARDYLASDLTVAFLRRDSINQQGDFTRQRAIEQVFSPSTIDQYFASESRRLCAYDALKNRNFENLRSIHEAYFTRPNQYAMNLQAA